jgi:hypothetical protein
MARFRVDDMNLGERFPDVIAVNDPRSSITSTT